MKKVVWFNLILAVIISLSACSESQNLPKTFGAELYNSSYISLDETMETRHIIPIMSKVDLTQAADLQIETSGGTYDFRYEIEVLDYKLDDYSLYNVVLYFSNVKIDSDALSVNQVLLYTDATNKIDISPDKCELVSIPYEYSLDHVNFNGVPLKVPSDMLILPVEISAEENITIEDILLTNNAISVETYHGIDGGESPIFKPTKVNKGDEIKNIDMLFSTDPSDLGKYKSFGTTIVIKYKYNDSDVMFYTVPAFTETIYNPFSPDYETIEKYYNDIVKGK